MAGDDDEDEPAADDDECGFRVVRDPSGSFHVDPSHWTRVACKSRTPRGQDSARKDPNPNPAITVVPVYLAGLSVARAVNMR